MMNHRFALMYVCMILSEFGRINNNTVNSIDSLIAFETLKKPLRRMVIEEIGTLTRDEEETKTTLDIPQDPADIHRVVTPIQNKG